MKVCGLSYTLRASADDGAWAADAICCKCRADVGVLRAEMYTLFGAREDRAVLGSGVRIY